VLSYPAARGVPPRCSPSVTFPVPPDSDGCSLVKRQPGRPEREPPRERPAAPDDRIWPLYHRGAPRPTRHRPQLPVTASVKIEHDHVHGFAEISAVSDHRAQPRGGF
jgi:hypothetical protein